jgi:hypothetical protein
MATRSCGSSTATTPAEIQPLIQERREVERQLSNLVDPWRKIS